MDKKEPIIFKTLSSNNLVPLNRPGSPKLESMNLKKASLAIGWASVHMEPKILPSEYLQSIAWNSSNWLKISSWDIGFSFIKITL